MALAALTPVNFVIVMLIFTPIFMLPPIAIVSALGHPREDWDTLGRNRTRWMVAFLFTFPFGIGVIAAAYYLLAIRPRLPRAASAGDFEEGTTVTAVVGPNARRPMRVIARPLLLRFSRFVKVEFLDDGDRGYMAAGVLRVMDPADKKTDDPGP